MGKRSTGRKLAVQAIYQTEIRKENLPDFIGPFLSSLTLQDDTLGWAEELSYGTWQKLEDVDQEIVKYAVGWDIERMNMLDKSILRVAFYELLFTETPHNVVIDEAIEVSKKYSTEESPKFINGILGQYIKTCSQD